MVIPHNSYRHCIDGGVSPPPPPEAIEWDRLSDQDLDDMPVLRELRAMKGL